MDSPELTHPEVLKEQDHIRNLGLDHKTSFVDQRVLVVHSTDKAPYGKTERYGASSMDTIQHEGDGRVETDAIDLNYITISDGPFSEDLINRDVFDALKPLVRKLKEPTASENPGEYNGGQLRIYNPYLGDDPPEIFEVIEEMTEVLQLQDMPCDIQIKKIDPDNPRSKFYLQVTRAKLD